VKYSLSSRQHSAGPFNSSCSTNIFKSTLSIYLLFKMFFDARTALAGIALISQVFAAPLLEERASLGTVT
jgi:hypothetical protein